MNNDCGSENRSDNGKGIFCVQKTMIKLYISLRYDSMFV